LRLRSHLVVLVLAAVIPLLVFALMIVRQDLAERRDILERGMQDTVHALSRAVDGEVKTSLAVLETLAGAVVLDRGDLQAFHEICVRAIQPRPTAYVTLFDTTGKPLLNSSRVYGVALPNPVAGTQPPGSDSRYPALPLGGGDPVSGVLETGAPVVSDLFISLVTGAPRISFDVPVVRGGAIRYVLEMSVDALEFTQHLRAQRAPADSVLAIVDRKGVAIARTLDPAGRVGRPLAPELAVQVSRAATGSGLGHTVEGMAVYHVYARSPVTGWTMSLSVARSVALAPLTNALAVLAGGAAIAIILGLAGALVLGRRISRPIADLARSADQLAGGRQPRLDVSAVRELEELYRALLAAGEAARNAEDERDRRQLAEAKGAEAQAANRAKDEFLAMLSHELRNPLAAMSAAAHVLRLADPASAQAASARRVIERQTKHMSRLIGDLLDVSRITHGKLALDRERLDLAEVVTRVVNVWRASGRFERHNVSLEVASVWVDADRARLEQITANLLDNALKFTPAGKAVTISVKPRAEMALLSVADEGPGVEPQAAQRIFDLFVQVTPGSEGLGIGLALVKRLSEIHGGSVSVANAGAGRGAVFTVRLAAVAPPSEAAVDVRPTASARRSVLIVDDNEDARHMLAALLRMEGHEVRTAADGGAGLALARDTPPEVALVDIRLPDMDGYEVARRLRAALDGRPVALVALTGFGRAEDQQRALDAGFDAHLVKPVSAERLKHLMAELA